MPAEYFLLIEVFMVFLIVPFAAAGFVLVAWLLTALDVGVLAAHVKWGE
jgi:hypothetical protein